MGLEPYLKINITALLNVPRAICEPTVPIIVKWADSHIWTHTFQPPGMGLESYLDLHSRALLNCNRATCEHTVPNLWRWAESLICNGPKAISEPTIWSLQNWAWGHIRAHTYGPNYTAIEEISRIRGAQPCCEGMQGKKWGSSRIREVHGV